MITEILIAGVSLIAIAVVCMAAIKIAEIKYGEVKRQDHLENRLGEIERILANATPEKMDAMKNDINDLKLKVGFR